MLTLLGLASPPDLALVGVVISPVPERSSAVLHSANGSRVVGLGESAFGGRLAAIKPSAVILEFPDGRLKLRLGQTLAARPTGEPPERTADSSPSEPGAVTMARADVQRRLARELPRILSETALVPVAAGGRVAGFALSRLPDGSLLSDAGLRPGDVLAEINGVPVDSLATLASLYARLQDAAEIHAVVLRGGSRVFLTVRIR